MNIETYHQKLLKSIEDNIEQFSQHLTWIVRGNYLTELRICWDLQGFDDDVSWMKLVDISLSLTKQHYAETQRQKSLIKSNFQTSPLRRGERMTFQTIAKLKRGCGTMFCEDCGSYNAEDEGHSPGCTEGNLGNVSCGTKDLEDELKLCPTCSAKIEELEALKSGVSHD
jgi:hypothetical protein